jgi:hypothetical protein
MIRPGRHRQQRALPRAGHAADIAAIFKSLGQYFRQWRPFPSWNQWREAMSVGVEAASARRGAPQTGIVGAMVERWVCSAYARVCNDAIPL